MNTDEPDYWWFELAILLNKTMMCGGLVVLNPGSPTQVVCAILIMMFHLLLVLKSAPYVHESEDWSAFASSLGLTLTYVGALVKMLQAQRRVEYDPHELYYADSAMNVLPIACVSIVILIMVLVDGGLWNYIKRKTSQQGDTNNINGTTNRSLTQVQPVNDTEEEKRLLSQIDVKQNNKAAAVSGTEGKIQKTPTTLTKEENNAVKNWG